MSEPERFFMPVVATVLSYVLIWAPVLDFAYAYLNAIPSGVGSEGTTSLDVMTKVFRNALRPHRLARLGNLMVLGALLGCSISVAAIGLRRYSYLLAVLISTMFLAFYIKGDMSFLTNPQLMILSFFIQLIPVAICWLVTSRRWQRLPS